MIPKPPKNQNVTCSFDIFALSSAWPIGMLPATVDVVFAMSITMVSPQSVGNPRGLSGTGVAELFGVRFLTGHTRCQVVTTLNVREARRA